MAQVEFAFPVGVGCIRRLTKKHPSGAFFLCISKKITTFAGNYSVLLLRGINALSNEPTEQNKQ